MTRFFICTSVLLSPSHSCGPGTRRAHPGHQCLPVRLGGCPAAAGLGPEEEGDGLFKKTGPDLRDIRPDVGSQPIRRFGVTGESRLAWSESKPRSGLIIVQVQVRHTATEKCTPVQVQSIFKAGSEFIGQRTLISKSAECRLYQWRQQQISVLYSGGTTFSVIYLLLSLPLRESKILPLHQ